MKSQLRNIPVALDEQLLAEIDAAAAGVKDSRSGVMRRAIREGLPLVKSGGKADAFTLDSALSADVDSASKETGLSRERILLGAIQAGFQAFVTRKVSEKLSLPELKDPKEREKILHAIEAAYKLYDDPMAIQCRRLILERGNAATELMDILQHVPEAKKRYELANRLTEIRKLPSVSGSAPVWGMGLGTAELEWQISMSEKHGPRSADWPDDEKRAHNEKMGYSGPAAGNPAPEPTGENNPGKKRQKKV